MRAVKQNLEKEKMTAGALAVTALLISLSGQPAAAGEFDYGAKSEETLENLSMPLFGVGKPLEQSASPTTGDYRAPGQAAGEQVLLAKGLKAEYITRQAAHNADQFAFWPDETNPTHLIFCIEEFTPHQIGTFPMEWPSSRPAYNGSAFKTGRSKRSYGIQPDATAFGGRALLKVTGTSISSTIWSSNHNPEIYT